MNETAAARHRNRRAPPPPPPPLRPPPFSRAVTQAGDSRGDSVFWFHHGPGMLLPWCLGTYRGASSLGNCATGRKLAANGVQKPTQVHQRRCWCWPGCRVNWELTQGGSGWCEVSLLRAAGSSQARARWASRARLSPMETKAIGDRGVVINLF
jgi:hypothetical protein